MSTLAQLAQGTVFAHDFRVVRPLADGGMGSVYVVEQLSTGRERALKLMHPQFVADPNNRRRFAEEARVGARIASDHVVEVIASGVDEGSGVPWLAMELLHGETLFDRVEKRGAVPPAEAYEVLRQVCHALGAAHRAGIVHRDVKPENIFLASTRREGAAVMVKVLDFGIATVAGTPPASAGMATVRAGAAPRRAAWRVCAAAAASGKRAAASRCTAPANHASNPAGTSDATPSSAARCDAAGICPKSISRIIACTEVPGVAAVQNDRPVRR